MKHKTSYFFITVFLLLVACVCSELVNKSHYNSQKIKTQNSEMLETIQQLRADNINLKRQNACLKLKINKYQRASQWSEYLIATLSETQQMRLSIAAERLRQKNRSF